MKQGLDKKKLIIRLSLVVVYAGLVMWVFVLGKGHSLIIDNKDLADGSLTAVAEGNLVSVDGKEASELYPGDRIMETVKGQTHTIAIEDISGGNRIERKIALPLSQDTLLVSIPKLIAGVNPAIEVLYPLIRPRRTRRKRNLKTSLLPPTPLPRNRYLRRNADKYLALAGPIELAKVDALPGTQLQTSPIPRGQLPKSPWLKPLGGRGNSLRRAGRQDSGERPDPAPEAERGPHRDRRFH